MAQERIRLRLAQDPSLFPTNLPAERTRRRSRASMPILPPPVYGNLSDIAIGAKWATRAECHKAGMHRQTVAGISGSAETGAYSVVLSGGYEDDDDEGDHFIYTGTGGRQDGDSYRGYTEQTQDQDWDHQNNKALLASFKTGNPVRVIRGMNANSIYAPGSGYRYDGLYKVTDAYQDKGRSGFMVCKAVFQRLPGQPPVPKQWRAL